MLYRPNFCCQCGEKVARARWTLLSSRRFCEFCEVEQKEHDLFVRGIVVISLLLGAAGLTSYVSSGGKNAAQLSQKSTTQTGEFRPAVDPKRQVLPRTNSNGSGAHDQTIQNSADVEPPVAGLDTKQRQPAANSSTEPVYYCGALTKKGTPCSRRVKAKGVRCWQHAVTSKASDDSR